MGFARDADNEYVTCHILCSSLAEIPLHARRLAGGLFRDAGTYPETRDSETV